MFNDPTIRAALETPMPTAGSAGRGRRRFGEACGARKSEQSFLRLDHDRRTVCQILLLPGFELNELAALTEAFATANRLLREPRFSWRLASLDGAPVRAAGEFAVAVQDVATAAEAPHLFILTGYEASAPAAPSLVAWLRRRHALGMRIAAIGGACPLLAEAGLLNQQPCAVHWSLAEAMLEGNRDIQVDERLFAIADRIATCAGRAATLDFMLRLIAEGTNERLARQVADRLNHARLREAGERQLSELEFSGKRGAAPLVHTVAAMRRRLSEGEDLAGIAAQAGISQRQLQRLFRRHLGMTPTQYFLKARLQRARHLLQYSALSVTEIAIATGFASISHFTRRYTELYGRTPTGERGRAGRQGRSKLSDAVPAFAA
jgi:transcriptional regulator GlxA family with amidase domain